MCSIRSSFNKITKKNEMIETCNFNTFSFDSVLITGNAVNPHESSYS